MSTEATKFFKRLAAISKNPREQGYLLERITQEWLRQAPVHKDRFAKISLWSEWAGAHGIDRTDTGIDLVAETVDGELCGIQCKNYAPDGILPMGNLTNFTSAIGSVFAGKTFASGMVITTAQKWSKHAINTVDGLTIDCQRVDFISELGRAEVNWAELNKLLPKYDLVDGVVIESGIQDSMDMPKTHKLDFSKLLGDLFAASRSEPKTPHPHQTEAIQKVCAGFKTADRGKMIMACGTGKTFTSLKIAETIVKNTASKNSGHVLFLVPSLSLLSQTLREWSEQSAKPIRAFAVCSDTKVGRDPDDMQLRDLAIPATTNAEKLRAKLEKSTPNMSVVFATYQSIDIVAKAQQSKAVPAFDLAICDEAHRTTGVEKINADKNNQPEKSPFIRIHDPDYIRAKKRLYMTATPRIYTDAAKSKAQEVGVDYFDMNRVDQYGEEFYRLGFGEAIKQELLSDYKVLIVAVNKERITDKMLSEAHAIGTTQTGRGKKYQVTSEDLVKIIGCWRGLAKDLKDPTIVLDREPMKRAVIFTNTINQSISITEVFPQVIAEFKAEPADSGKAFLDCQLAHVDGTQDALLRNKNLNWLKQKPAENACHILSNVRCLSEGVDVPALDAAIFLNPRKSQVDIVQSVGRVMRKAEGKKEGYIILPVITADDADAEQTLDKNESFQVVWSILKALRSHDERLDMEINQLDINKGTSERIKIIDDIGKTSEEAQTEPDWEQLRLEFDRTPFENAIYATIVEKCGDRKYIEKWAKDVALVAEKTTASIIALLEKDKNAAEEYAKFLTQLQSNLNPAVTSEAATEMLSQHLITRPIFDQLFGSEQFAAENPVSQTMQAMLDCFDAKNLAAETDGLEAFYQDMRNHLERIDNAEGKQKIVNELYEKFFKIAFPKMAESLGIVYTPIPVVDFIIRSIDDLLRQEFGRSISDKNINLLDPFTGTGTFITQLLKSDAIKDADLKRKFSHEIHANEIVLLAYYIAAVNIEQSYQARLANAKTKTAKPPTYQPFPGIALTDTFQINEGESDTQTEINEMPAAYQNSERIEKQRNTPITVVFGNPPYSAGQKSQNDDNKNLKYERLDSSIANTYAKYSNAGLKRKIYDSYIRAIRWASNRISSDGIVACVTNGGYIDSHTMDGFRKCLADEFSSIYCVNLRGNIRKNMQDKTAGEGENIFGQGSMTAVAILLLVKKAKAEKTQAKVYYHDIGDNLSRVQKLNALDGFANLRKMDWKNIKPDANNDWLDQQNPEFSTYLPLGDKENKTKKSAFVSCVFSNFSLGTGTNRDAWVYSFSRQALENNMQSTIGFYNSEITRYQEFENVANLDSFVDADASKLSWTRSLKSDLRKGKFAEFSATNIRLGQYRPFCKQHLYFHPQFNESISLQPSFFPTPETKNLAIYIVGKGVPQLFTLLMVNQIPDLNLISAGQCFPRYTYAKTDLANGEYERVDNIPPATVTQFREQYADSDIDGDAIFYYVYGVLHNPEYKTKFAADLKKTLPRIPFAKTKGDFWAYADAGKRLAELHVGYEEVTARFGTTHETNKLLSNDSYFVVKKMKYRNKDERSEIIYNENIRISGIPLKAQQYVVNGKPALDWIIDRYQYKTDKASGIVNDPNQWSDDPRYIIELVRKVATVSVDTVEIIEKLPGLF